MNSKKLRILELLRELTQTYHLRRYIDGAEYVWRFEADHEEDDDFVERYTNLNTAQQRKWDRLTEEQKLDIAAIYAAVNEGNY